MKKEFLNESKKMQRLAGVIDKNQYKKAIKEDDSEVKEFRFKVKHDNGFKKLKTKASSLEAAKKIIMNAEGCPEGAIELISENIHTGEKAPDNAPTAKSASGPSQEQKMYLDYVNNFVSVERFAEYYGISEEKANEIIAKGRNSVDENLTNETRLDYMDDIGGAPTTLPDEAKNDLKHWLCIYEEGGEFSLYEEFQYVAKDYEGEYIDTEHNYYNKISKNSNIEDVKKFLRRIYELAEKNPDYKYFKFESVSCGVHEIFKTYEDLTNAFGDCFFKK